MAKFQNAFYITVIVLGLSFIGAKVYSYFENSSESQSYSKVDALNYGVYSALSEIDDNDTLTEVKIRQRVINLGKLTKGDLAEFNFIITNTGDNNLILKNIEPECHCTVARWEKSRIKPGDSTTITAIYNTSYLGYFQKLVRVDVNTSDSPLTLILRGEVLKEIK